jgi:predicted aspartyl protease
VSFPFNSHQGLILVKAELWGPAGNAAVMLAVDTGATGTLVSQTRLIQLGYDPVAAPTRVQITTGSGVVFVPRFEVMKIVSLGQERQDFPVLGHNLPPGTGIDGVLGLDFLRGLTLTVDFRTGQLSLQ